MLANRIVSAALLLGLANLLLPATASAESSRVSQEEIENTYRAKKQGQHLYRAGKYAEAIEYLEFAAQRGFKQPQAQLGSIYLNGLGDVEKDLVQGIGWLGVAAYGETDAEIKKLFDKVWAQLPEQHKAPLQRVVDQFTQRYDGRKTRVVCDLDQRAGTNRRELRCKYVDESQYPHLDIEI